MVCKISEKILVLLMPVGDVLIVINLSCTHDVETFVFFLLGATWSYEGLLFLPFAAWCCLLAWLACLLLLAVCLWLGAVLNT